MRSVSRRTAAAGVLAALILAGCVSRGDLKLPAEVAATLQYSAISVDVSPLQAKGLTDWAAIIQQATAAQLTKEFADRRTTSKTGATLQVIITGVTLTSFVGGDGGDLPMDGGSSTDYLEGDAFVISSTGETLAKQHILLALPSDGAGAWYLPNIDQLRLVYLSTNFARWVKSYFHP
ncbi:MAG: hypothetical protein KF735_02015 [Chelatococcus sp.]|jgi:outer membrane murein-binding lipoprotein Lpp|uniref:hypothetical protein n=1 Tax=unclassified Chelatococcus TaxID=2638111 RepID=UPI001BD022F4|nr:MULTISPECIES: hypothetical protein [unclassified Chelatococcus]CAH1665340.1 conserved hypothetical protein [Hyphomicrobiales bacterium]MBS7737705.1 hypothetical protein [Chelatococcus sp. HY11]MBX3536388.1 hypothetical protein [Chelatococcus sp.]MBX3544161.1 hypothetical protein [Chelatococcus sp.]MCO5079517.1 hypothetical protein [Chelatococcus sp.]